MDNSLLEAIFRVLACFVVNSWVLIYGAQDVQHLRKTGGSWRRFRNGVDGSSDEITDKRIFFSLICKVIGFFAYWTLATIYLKSIEVPNLLWFGLMISIPGLMLLSMRVKGKQYVWRDANGVFEKGKTF